MACHRCEDLVIILAELLRISLRDQPCLVLRHLPRRVPLQLEHPAATNRLSVRRKLDQVSRSVVRVGLQLVQHGSFPLILVPTVDGFVQRPGFDFLLNCSTGGVSFLNQPNWSDSFVRSFRAPCNFVQRETTERTFPVRCTVVLRCVKIRFRTWFSIRLHGRVFRRLNLSHRCFRRHDERHAERFSCFRQVLDSTFYPAQTPRAYIVRTPLRTDSAVPPPHSAVASTGPYDRRRCRDPQKTCAKKSSSTI